MEYRSTGVKEKGPALACAWVCSPVADAQVEAAYERYIQAFESGDPEALKQSTTEEMYPIAMVGLKAARAFGVNLSGMHVGHRVDKIEGSTAYVNTESTCRGVKRQERVVLTKNQGRWLVAGKQ